MNPIADHNDMMKRVYPLLSIPEAVRFNSSVEVDMYGRVATTEGLRIARRCAVRSLWSHMVGYGSGPSADDWARLVKIDALLDTRTVVSE